MARLFLSLPLVLCGCLEVVDLTGDDGAPLCSPGQRFDEARAACVACIAAPPLEPLCPCEASPLYGALPYCEGEITGYDCLPCTGDITSCAGLDATRLTVTSCDGLLACCGELALDPESTSCCPTGMQVNCTETASRGEYRFSCAGETCCVGAACSTDGDCADAWQTCEDGHCAPACNSATQYCSSSEAGCECLERTPPT